MNRLKKAWLWACIAAALGVIGFASTTPALASTYTLNLTMPASTTVGKPVVIQAWGVQPPPSEYWSLAWLEVTAIPTAIASDCPASAEDASTVAAWASPLREPACCSTWSQLPRLAAASPSRSSRRQSPPTSSSRA
jgi:hypothetical protein